MKEIVPHYLYFCGFLTRNAEGGVPYGILFRIAKKIWGKFSRGGVARSTASTSDGVVSPCSPIYASLNCWHWICSHFFGKYAKEEEESGGSGEDGDEDEEQD